MCPKKKEDGDPIQPFKSFDMNPQMFKSFFGKFITERIKDTGLTESQAIFLFHLDVKNGISLKELTELLCVHKSLTTRMVKILINGGFIVNESESGKEYSVVLTEKGAKAKTITESAFDELFKLIMKCLTEEEVEIFYNLAMKVRDRVIELSEEEQQKS